MRAYSDTKPSISCGLTQFFERGNHASCSNVRNHERLGGYKGRSIAPETRSSKCAHGEKRAGNRYASGH